MQFIIHADGGARGNPGPSAIGAVIEQDNSGGHRTTVLEVSTYIGETTNNIAEYTAVLEALRSLRDYIVQQTVRDFDVHVILDSRLVVNQLNGIFKVKDAAIREKIAYIRIVEQEIGGSVRYTLVSRYNNTRADVLVNKALDAGR